MKGKVELIREPPGVWSYRYSHAFRLYEWKTETTARSEGTLMVRQGKLDGVEIRGKPNMRNVRFHKGLASPIVLGCEWLRH
jgi:hypothetical protein